MSSLKFERWKLQWKLRSWILYFNIGHKSGSGLPWNETPVVKAGVPLGFPTILLTLTHTYRHTPRSSIRCIINNGWRDTRKHGNLARYSLIRQWWMIRTGINPHLHTVPIPKCDIKRSLWLVPGIRRERLEFMTPNLRIWSSGQWTWPLTDHLAPSAPVKLRSWTPCQPDRTWNRRRTNMSLNVDLLLGPVHTLTRAKCYYQPSY